MYVIGKTGMGKTAMIQNMAIQDIQEGRGVGFVDPHGEAAEELLDFVPSNRINDVVYINPADLNYPIAFNVMEKVDFRYGTSFIILALLIIGFGFFFMKGGITGYVVVGARADMDADVRGAGKAEFIESRAAYSSVIGHQIIQRPDQNALAAGHRAGIRNGYCIDRARARLSLKTVAGPDSVAGAIDVKTGVSIAVLSGIFCIYI